MMLAIPQAMASLTGIPMETRIGIRILAPPRPVRAPRNPTGIDPKSSETMLSIEEILWLNKNGSFPNRVGGKIIEMFSDSS